MTSLLEPSEAEWREVPERAIELYLAKQARDTPPYSPTLRHVSELMQVSPSTTGIPNYPNPLMNMLAGGLTGAGLGYGAGWLGEHLLPERWQRGRLRRTAAILGGLGGVVPGALWAYSNLHNDKSLLSGSPFDKYPNIPTTAKQALYEGSGAFGDGLPLINRNHFNQVIWGDPDVAPNIPLATRAAASGLLAGAAHLADGARPSNLVSPFDVARMAAGMGSGYMSGLAVGRTLGILTGMPQSTQDFLKTTGIYAGVVKSIIPRAFGA